MAQAVTKEGYLEGEWVRPLVFFHSISLESQHITQLASRFFSFPKICTLSVKQTHSYNLYPKCGLQKAILFFPHTRIILK